MRSVIEPAQSSAEKRFIGKSNLKFPRESEAAAMGDKFSVGPVTKLWVKDLSADASPNWPIIPVLFYDREGHHQTLDVYFICLVICPVKQIAVAGLERGSRFCSATGAPFGDLRLAPVSHQKRLRQRAMNVIEIE